MYTSPTGGASSANNAATAWNAIASIKAVSPFDDGSASSSSSVADEFNSLVDTSAADELDGNTPSTDASTAAASSGSSGSDLAILRQIQNAEQSTVDLYA